MSVTSEPPWINKASGNVTASGTTTTINFGFTAGSGTLLILIVYAAATNTVSAGGWTERQQPVNSAEHSLFTATGAGQTGVVITNNGSGYVTSWICYEFEVGSTYTNSSSQTIGGSDAFIALGSLPGTEQVIIAAWGRDAGTTTSTSSTSWGSPWVEDVDVNLPRVGGVGEAIYHTVAHQINFTGTTITPAPTITWDGSGAAIDRQTVTVAIDVYVPPAGAPYPLLLENSNVLLTEDNYAILLG